jgi:hypothetical protein
MDDETHLLCNCDTARNACNEDGDLRLILDTSADNKEPPFRLPLYEDSRHGPALGLAACPL